jgi:NitT/TauT family transport system permease protein
MSKQMSLLQRCLTPKAEIPPAWRIGAGMTVWLLVLAIWGIGSYGHYLPSIFMPTPGAVIGEAVTLTGNGTLLTDIWVSAEVVLVGFFLSSLFAIPLGLLMGSFRIVQAALEPLVNFIRYLPVTSFVPLFILWIGIDAESRIAVSIFGTFFQQIVMIADGVNAVPEDLLNASYTLGASRRDVLFHVLAPAAWPSILNTLRVTMGWAWTYLVAAELVASSSGLGHLSIVAMRGFQVDKIFLAIAIIGLLGLITDRAFALARRRFAAWAQ